jgi:hypothetical protein
VSDEAKVLLKHPDERERAMALKLDSITPEDVARAILDPSELVFKEAFHHPSSSHALDVLAASSRDAAGFPLHARHDLLLNDPRCHSGHVDAIHRAVQNDAHLPIAQQAARLSVLKLRSPLLKKEQGKIRLANADDPLERVVAVSQEEDRHPDLFQHYKTAFHTGRPIHPQDADLHQEGKSPKVIYHVPHEKGTHKFIVNPYLEEDVPLSGWAEGTSQELYHSASIPHLHQKSFVASYDNGNRDIPVSVIHMEESKPIHKVPQQEVLEKNPNAAEDARKIALMDFLTGNGDRHTNNLMVKPDGQLLAIDHGQAFTYEFPQGFDTFGNPKAYAPTKKNSTHLKKYTLRSPALLTHSDTDADPSQPMPVDLDYHKTIKHWWPLVSPDVRRTFEKRLQLVQSPAIKRHLMAGFTARHQWLDRMAGIEPEQFQEELKKSVQDPDGHDVIGRPPLEAKKYDSVHSELIGQHPKKIQPNVNRFEKHINDPNKTVKPDREDSGIGGIERKVLVSHGTQKYLIKGASTQWNPLSGWGELTSQAMYHAGGIGHLHQHSHATHVNIKEGDNVRKQPAVAIHFQPGKWRTLSAVKEKGDRDFYNKHDGDLRKIYLMDFLTGNGDRHDENILVGPEGQPQAIDHGFAFRRDNWDTPKDQEEDPFSGNIAGAGEAPNGKPFNFKIFSNDHGFGLNGKPDTYDWWQQNKEPIVKSFYKHLDMIPDKKERDRRRGMFDYRVQAVDNKHPSLFDKSDWGYKNLFDKFYGKSEDLTKGAMARLHPFTPRAPGTPETYAEPLNDWVSDENPHAREQLGLMGMEPNAKARALHKLHASTEVRRNPHTNEREFLLHRGFGATQLHTLRTPGKYDGTAPRTDKTKSKRAIPYTSWSVDPNETHTSDHMVSAWIPESKIAFHIPQYNKMPGLNETTQQLGQDEKEVIVDPGQYDIFHKDRGRDWLHNLKQKMVGLHKSLGSAEFLHGQHTAFPTQQGMQANMTGVHEKLLKAVPSSIGSGIRHFELAINQSKNPVAPVAEQKDLQGLQPKALYHHNGKKYLVKAAVENSTAMGAWNEITHQALYHAGNIGHLHQKVHATIGQTGLNRNEPAHALAIHMENDGMTLGDASGWEDGKGNKYPPKDLNRFHATFKNPEHVESLRRIGMMDHLTGNGDRHLMNIVLKPDGSPIAIDHGRAFHPHRKHALGREESTDLHGTDAEGNPMDHEPGFLLSPGYRDQFIPDYKSAMEESLAAQYGGEPTKDTWDWWNQNKDAIKEKFKEHLMMLPDADQRQKMYNVFMLRHNRLSNEFQQTPGQPLQNKIS